MLLRKALVGCALAAAAVLYAVPGASAAVTYPPDYSAPNQAWNVLAPGEAGNQPAGGQLVQPGAALRRPDAELRHGHRRVASDLLQEERVRPRRRARRSARSARPATPASIIERDAKGVAHITGTTRADGMFGVGFVSYPGPRPADGAAARAVAAGGDRRSRHRPVPDPRRGTHVHAVRADRGLPRVADRRCSRASGPDGQQIIDDVDAYVAGINAARTAAASRRRRGRATT